MRSYRTNHGERRFVAGLTILTTAAIAVAIVGAQRSAQPAVTPLPTPLPPQAGCATASTAGSLCIVILGDSIAQGVPVTGDDRWWIRLQRLLATALPGRTVTIDNWAVSGSQIDVLESAARDQPAIGTFDMAIVVEGVNDLAVRPVEAWQPRYAAAIAMLESKGVMAIMTTPPPSFEYGTFGIRYDAMAAAIRDLSQGRRAVLDLAARWHADGPAMASTYYVDTIHESLTGQILMASVARDVVLKAIATP
jgi:lysophospholipase L1-like esterase